jgi:hypothetical protein
MCWPFLEGSGLRPYESKSDGGHHTSNIVESFNGLLEKDRFLPVLDLLDALWTRYTNIRFERKQIAPTLLESDNGEIYTEFALKILAESLENSQHRRVYLADHEHGQVDSFSGNNYFVDLTKPICTTCGRFQVNDIPYGHAIACLRRLNRAPHDHTSIPEFFNLEHYHNRLYEKNVHLVKISDLQAEATDNCLPPILKRGRGRPRTRWIRKGERQPRRERRERQGLLPDVEDRLTNRCRLSVCRT